MYETPAYPLVTTIIPTYNFGKYVVQAIKSVQNQTVGNLEIIIIDDGSTDDTESRIEEIVDQRIIKIKIEHSGVSAARNVGLNNARGVYVGFLDADDLWAPNKLEKQIALAESLELGAVFTNFKRFGILHLSVYTF